MSTARIMLAIVGAAMSIAPAIRVYRRTGAHAASIKTGQMTVGDFNDWASGYKAQVVQLVNDSKIDVVLLSIGFALSAVSSVLAELG